MPDIKKIIKNTATEIINQKNIGLYVVFLCLFMQMLDWGAAYRLFAYLNIVLVLFYSVAVIKNPPGFKAQPDFYYLLVIPLAFIANHFLAVENIVIIKEIRHIFIALFLVLSIWLMAKKNPDYIKKNSINLLIILIFAYTIIQAIALWYFKQSYGTTKNPHYLAIYSALLFITAFFCFFKTNTILKYLLAISILILGSFILGSSSRPAWIAMIFTGCLTLCFLNNRIRILSALSILVVLIGLSFTNAGHFASRSTDLLEHLSTEERVVIWQNTWQMQSASTPKQWLTGHGLNTFKENFKPFSNYHLQQIDFNSPHNFLLELLYISGMIGLTLAIAMYWIIYRKIIQFIKKDDKNRPIYLLLLAILTTNLIFVSITLPFFTAYNLNIIALVVGVMFYLHQNDSQQARLK